MLFLLLSLTYVTLCMQLPVKYNSQCHPNAASGKSTIAVALESALLQLGKNAALLDGGMSVTRSYI